MTLKDAILGTVAAVGLAGTIYKGIDLHRSIGREIDAETPAVQRLNEISDNLEKMANSGNLVRGPYYQEVYLNNHREYDTLMKTPSVRGEYEKYQKNVRERQDDYLSLLFFGFPFAISAGYLLAASRFNPLFL